MVERLEDVGAVNLYLMQDVTDSSDGGPVKKPLLDKVNMCEEKSKVSLLHRAALALYSHQRTSLKFFHYCLPLSSGLR